MTKQKQQPLVVLFISIFLIPRAELKFRSILPAGWKIASYLMKGCASRLSLVL